MPLYWCPDCKRNRPLWDIRSGICDSCGYSITKPIVTPSKYQKGKIDKHILVYQFPDIIFCYVLSIGQD